jgi:hypothetical protein
MIRRNIALLLTVSLLQPGMWCVHSHAGISDHEPSGMLRAPHFHLRFVYSLWRQPASESPRTTLPSAGLQTASLPRSESTADHDADALYLPLSIVLGWDNGPPVDLLVPPAIADALPLDCLQAPALLTATAARACRPVVSGDPCPPYLRSLALLI